MPDKHTNMTFQNISTDPFPCEKKISKSNAQEFKYSKSGVQTTLE